MSNMFIRASSLMIALSFLIPSMLLFQGLGEPKAPISDDGDSLRAVIQSNPTSLNTQVYYVTTENFGSTNISDWYQWKGDAGATIEVTGGELHLKNYSWAGVHVRHPLNVSKQLWNFSMNFRMASTTVPDNNPTIVAFESSVYTDITAAYTTMGIILKLMDNRSVQLTVDEGTKKATPGYSYYYTDPLANDTNYMINLDFGASGYDTVDVQLINHSAGSEFYSATHTTFGTNINCTKPLPDRISIGNLAHSSNVWMDWYLDNITAWQYVPITTGIVLANSSVDAAVRAYGEKLKDIEFETDKFRLGYSLTDSSWDTSPAYYLEPYIPTNSRDDVAGDVIETACNLYEYTGETAYLQLAQDVWDILETHQQPDGGFTFGTNNSDYCMHNARIILGLCALYRNTGEAEYLTAIESIAPWLMDFQQSNGMAYSRVDRPASYSINYDLVETGYLAIGLLEAYKYIDDEDYLDSALLACDLLANKVTESGRIPCLADGISHGDNNDVVFAGIGLWALCEGYKMSANETYLTKAGYVADWLATAQFANSTLAYGMWSGFMKDRHNQSDILYSYVVPLGLLSYYSIVSNDTLVNGAIQAAIKIYLSMQGHNESVISGTIYGYDDVWSACWNFNDTSDQGWTTGWWCEGGWGTWGQIVFYGWQGNLVKALIEYLTPEATDTLYLGNMAMADENGTHIGLISSNITTPTTIGISSDDHTTMLLTAYDPDQYTVGSVVATFTLIASSSTTTTITMSGLEDRMTYGVYENDSFVTSSVGPSCTFEIEGSGDFEIRFGYDERVNTLIALTVDMVLIGVFVVLAISYVSPIAQDIKEKRQFDLNKIAKKTIMTVVFIVIALILWGVLRDLALS